MWAIESFWAVGCVVTRSRHAKYVRRLIDAAVPMRLRFSFRTLSAEKPRVVIDQEVNRTTEIALKTLEPKEEAVTAIAELFEGWKNGKNPKEKQKKSSFTWRFALL